MLKEPLNLLPLTVYVDTILILCMCNNLFLNISYGQLNMYIDTIGKILEWYLRQYLGCCTLKKMFTKEKKFFTSHNTYIDSIFSSWLLLVPYGTLFPRVILSHDLGLVKCYLF